MPRGIYPRKKKSRFTESQKVATGRNWCLYVLKGMIGLTSVFSRYGVEQEKVDRLRKTLESFEWSIEKAWMDKKDEIAKLYVEPEEVGKVIELKRRRG